MPRLRGSRALLELFRQEGIEFIFGNPGTTELPLIDALSEETEIRYVMALNEPAAMSIADGYAQAARKPAAVNLHAAPGLGNALGMLYDAQRAGSPLIVTAGQHDQGIILTEPLLWGDLTTMAKPFVKWAHEVRRLADLPAVVHRAVKIALTPPTGPVFLSLPTDVLDAEEDIDLGTPTRVAPLFRGDRAAIEAAARLLAQAERPVIIAGDSVAQTNGIAALVALAEAFGAPVYLEGVDNSVPFPSDHPLFAGAMIRLADPVRKVLDRHDLLLSIGADLVTVSLPGTTEPMPPGLKIVHLDNDAWELGKSYHADVAILGDPGATLPDLTAALMAALTPAQTAAAAARRRRHESEIRAARADLRARAHAGYSSLPLKPLSVLQAIAETLPANAVVVDESISSGQNIHTILSLNDAQAYFGQRGGGIGWGLPAAIGVKLGLPDRPVVALLGDGASLYTVQALWTAAHERINLVFVILNNHSYRVLKQRVAARRPPERVRNRFVGLDMVDPTVDFVSMAKGFGIAASRVTTIPEMVEALRRGLASDLPSMIEVTVDDALG